MVTVCWAAKGGSGTTVIVASLAAIATEPMLVVDLAGDVPAALGLARHDLTGVNDWLTSDVPPERLGALEVEVRPGIHLLPAGSRELSGPARHAALATWLSADRRHVVIDAGTGEPPPDLLRIATSSWLVTRPCYLSLRASMRQHAQSTGVVVIEEPGRALAARDIENAVGAPVVLQVLQDPAVARAVDAGLLVSHLPRAFRRRVAESV